MVHEVSGIRLSARDVPAAEGVDPASPVARVPGPGAVGISREAGLRIALFLLVLVLAASAAWGAGRVLGAGIDPAAVQHSHH